MIMRYDSSTLNCSELFWKLMNEYWVLLNTFSVYLMIFTFNSVEYIISVRRQLSLRDSKIKSIYLYMGTHILNMYRFMFLCTFFSKTCKIFFLCFEFIHLNVVILKGFIQSNWKILRNSVFFSAPLASHWYYYELLHISLLSLFPLICFITKSSSLFLW